MSLGLSRRWTSSNPHSLGFGSFDFIPEGDPACFTKRCWLYGALGWLAEMDLWYSFGMRYFFGRNGILLSLIIVLTAALFTGIFCTSSKKQITREDYEKLRIGMTFDEVRAVFGRDPDGKGKWPLDCKTLDWEWSVWTDHVTPCGGKAVFFPPGGGGFVSNGLIFDGNTAGVSFDAHGRVTGTCFGVSHAPPSIFERVRDWIRAKMF